MNWINSRQFTISNRNGRHYVFRRNNAGNTEINIPKHIVSKGQAVAWLKANPNKVANPTRFNPKRTARAAPPPVRKVVVPYKYVPPPPPKPPLGGWRFPGPKIYPYKPLANLPLKNVVNFPSPSKNTWNMSCAQLKNSFKSFKAIGRGRQGIVFAASRSAAAKHPFAVKIAPRDLDAKKRGEMQPVDVEYTIQSAVQKLSPNVVRVYKNMRCVDFIAPDQIDMPNVQNSSRYDKTHQGILIMEFADGGSLDSWLKKTAKVDDKIMANLISDILGAILAIQKKYPDFRHNDLHMQNVFVAERGFLIGDFGWARLKKSGTNPAVNTANGTKTASLWGVGPKTDERYDHHLFLNELLTWAMKHSPADHPKAIAFLKKAIPEGYRGEKDIHISEWRLKYEDPCTGLPSLAQIMSYPFLAGKRRVASPNLKAAKAALKLVKVNRILSVNLLKAKAALKAPKKILSLHLRKAKAALKRVAQPKPKPHITGYNLRAAKAKLRKVPSPPKKKVKVPPALIKTAKFNKLVEKLWKNAGAASGANFQNAWNSARTKAVAVIANRLGRNLPAFTPSPVKLPSPLSPLGPPKPRAKLPSPLSPLGPPPKPRAKAPSPVKRSNFRLSPGSGRAKVKSKNSGRWVYANLYYSMEELKGMAAQLNVNIKGLRSKANIAKKLFG